MMMITMTIMLLAKVISAMSSPLFKRF